MTTIFCGKCWCSTTFLFYFMFIHHCHGDTVYRMIGWMTDWHIKKNYTNPAHLNHIIFLAQQSVIFNLSHPIFFFFKLGRYNINWLIYVVVHLLIFPLPSCRLKLPLFRQLSNLEHLSRMMETSLSEVFFTDTVEEWIGVYVSPMISKVKEVLDSANKQLELGGRPREHMCLPWRREARGQGCAVTRGLGKLIVELDRIVAVV